MSFPIFKYFADPIGCGSFIESGNVCVSCHLARGYVYAISPYAPNDHDEEICPWCISDGSAAKLIDGKFNSTEGIGGFGAWDNVSNAVVEDVSLKTPGFAGIQDEQWFTHCADAAQFVGYATTERLLALGPKVVSEFLESLGEGNTYEDFVEFGDETLDRMSEDGPAQGYLFKCLHCGCHGGYVDQV